MNPGTEASPFTDPLSHEDMSTPQETTVKLRKSTPIEFWLRPFTRLHKIPVFKRVWLYLAIMGGYTAFVDWFGQEFPTHALKEAGDLGYMGAIMGLLLVFRTNSAYERWWEGRKLWGQLVNDSRNLCLKTQRLFNIKESEKAKVGELVVSFAYALKHHLRDTKPSRNLPGVNPLHAQGDIHLPVYIAGEIFGIVMNWRRMNVIDGMLYLALDQHMRALMDIAGACERIKSTPLAVSYRAFMRQGITLNLILLPWYLAPSFALYWSMPIVLLAAYFLVGLELIAEDIEEPFGDDGDDLPLDQICSNIRKSVTEIFQVQSGNDALVDTKFTTSHTRIKIDPLSDLSG